MIVLGSGPFQVLQLLYRTRTSKKGVEKFRKAQEHVIDYHHALWPGIEVLLLSSKHAKVAQDDRQSFWLRQNTLPTSMVFALIAYGINYKFRNVVDRTLVCSGLTSIVSKLASTLGGFELLHDRFGVESNDRVTLQVDSSGRVQVSALWGATFFQRFVRQWWRKDAVISAKTWVNGPDPGRQILLSEFLTFCLDPQHSEAFQRKVLGVCYSMLTRLAAAVENNIDAMRSETSVKLTDVSKKRKRVDSGIMHLQAQRVANRIWKNEVSQSWFPVCLF